MTGVEKTVGHETLDRIASSLGRYNTWLAEEFTPHVRGKVLEIGSGVGNLSAFFVDRPEEVYLTDVSETYLNILQERFGDRPHVRVLPWDLGKEPPAECEPGTFDTVVSSNVLEHIEDDLAALLRIRRLLAPGGRLVLLVPAHQALYNDFDRNLDHFRRYDKGSLGALLTKAGFTPRKLWYINVVGALGWFVSGSIMRRKILPTGQMKVFDMLVPLLKAERLVPLPFGISVIAVAER